MGKGSFQTADNKPHPQPQSRVSAGAVSTYCFFLLTEQRGAGQKVFILCIRNDGLWKFSEIQFQQGCHSVDVGVAAGTEVRRHSLGMSFHDAIYLFTICLPKRIATKLAIESADRVFRKHTLLRCPVDATTGLRRGTRKDAKPSVWLENI
jgi:hypothetical protein